MTPKRQPIIRRLLLVVIAALSVTLVGAAVVSSADASGELVAPQDEPALCGSVVDGLAGYNGAVLIGGGFSKCIQRTTANSFLITHVDTNTDYSCHVDLSTNRLGGIVEAGEPDWFPLGWEAFCIIVVVDESNADDPPVVTPAGPADGNPCEGDLVLFNHPDLDRLVCATVEQIQQVLAAAPQIEQPVPRFTG